MLVITFRTVTFIVAWRWCSRRTISSAVVPCGREELLEPAERGRDRRVLVAQPLEELDRAAVGSAARESRRRDAAAASGLVRAEAEQAVGELVRRLARRPAAHDLLREAAEVLDEEDPQADRDRPQLADRQRLDLLVGAHHAPQALRVEAAVRVRDVGPGETEDPRVAREVALGELGELAVVVRGQVVADLAELLVDDVEVVDEPLGGRRDRAFVLDRPGQDAVRLQQDAAVLGDARPDGASPAGRVGDRLGGGQRLGVLLEALDAEELGEDRLLELGRQANPAGDRDRAGLGGTGSMSSSALSAWPDPAYPRLHLGTCR